MSKVPYAFAIGSLMYVIVCTRPDISYAVVVVSRYISNSGKQHWEAVKWILRYPSGTVDTALCFRISSIDLHGYVDTNMVGDLDS